MFSFFRNKKISEQKGRCNYFYYACISEIEEYVKTHSAPTKEDLMKIAVNAKITYELFRNVKYIQPSARKALYPYTTNGLAVLIKLDNMEETAALKKLQSLVQETFKQLEEDDTSDLTLPAVNRAFIISKIINFDQTL